MKERMMQDIKDYVEFENSTSINYPWAMPAEEILTNVEEIAEVCNSIDTDDIHCAIDRICGINPKYR